MLNPSLCSLGIVFILIKLIESESHFQCNTHYFSPTLYQRNPAMFTVDRFSCYSQEHVFPPETTNCNCNISVCVVLNKQFTM